MKSRSKYLVLTKEYLIPLGIICLIALGYYLTFKTNLFELTEIKCTQDYQPCQNQSLISELDKSLHSNLLSLDKDRLKARLLSGEYTIREVSIRPQLPHTLKVELLSTYPSIALQLSSYPQQWLVLDSRNRVLDFIDHDPNVKTLTLDVLPKLKLGDQLTDAKIIQAIEALKQVSASLPKVESAYLDQDFSLSLSLPNNLQARLSLTKNISQQIEVLNSILLDKDLIAKHYLIDLRFSRPVLK